jgi:protein ImuA
VDQESNRTNQEHCKEIVMGAIKPTLTHLRQALVGLDPSMGPALPEEGRAVGFETGIDAVLGGGLSCGALHELAPAEPIHLPAATGFGLALAALSGRKRGETLWIATDFAVCESGGPYGSGLDLFGLVSARLIVLRVARAVDVLWAMEEALRCGALASVIAELTGDGAEADLTATRRLSLAAREGKGGCLGLLLRHRVPSMPSAALTRWNIAAAPSEPDRFGGLGRAAFDLSLVKNRRGPCGRWLVTWDHHEHVFQPAISVGVAAAAFDRSDRAPLALTG